MRGSEPSVIGASRIDINKDKPTPLNDIANAHWVGQRHLNRNVKEIAS